MYARRFLAPLLILVSSAACGQQMNKATTGALTGGTMGAGLGAIIGSQTGHAGPGIAIGAAAGALGGALIGNQLDNTDQQQAALRGETEHQQATLEENRRILQELRNRGADVRTTDRGVVVNLPDVLFEFDRARLTREAFNTVGDIGNVIRDFPGRSVAVEGHTDSVGTNDYNRSLSRRRAESVASELAASGVPRSRIHTHGFGESRPISSNETSSGRARNRRVEVIIENR